ncbi:hypothetical protein EDB92DRAFT_2021182 [Lactarius akahatsu]|uniref:CCHC-type domain-containing protein n=1 Tax=Lactarius akahatsu TaxID=416441 RepID=A0AAD4LBA6_9AGAM|nr:hypothetical protein EDB92DRAFT_2021182 [Lactarius akahatsu]
MEATVVRSVALDRENALDLGWWLPEDEANPDRLPIPIAPIPVNELVQPEYREYIDKDIPLDLPLPDPVKELTEAFRRLTPIHVDLALVESSTHAPTPTVSAVPSAPPVVSMAAAPLTGALKGTPPTLFTGNRADSEQFLREFRLYRKLNRDHTLMQNPYSRVICVLGFIRGPTINNWVNIEEQKLDNLVARTTNPIAETDEQLWTTFETSFKAAWTDTLSKQNAYQKLTTLQMKGDDADTYVSQFGFLANAAEWHRDASGTVEFFRRGLTKSILRACILRTTPPESMTEWQDAARAEVQRARILDSCLRARGIKSSRRTDPVPITSNVTIPPLAPPIDGVVPMDVDAISTSHPRGPPLSDAERDRCMREHRCFRCKQQGHLSLSCPSRSSPPRAHVNAVTVPSIPATSSPQVPNVIRDILGLSSAERQQVINSLLLADDALDPSTPAAQINTLELSFAASLPNPAPSYPPSPVPRPISPFRSPAHLALLGFTPVDETPRSPVASPPRTPHPAPVHASPPPRPPRSPLRPSSPRIALLSIVEGDNQPNRGVKTFDNSVSAPEIVAQIPSPTKITYYPTLFQSRAYESPRDPDEITPVAPVTRVQTETRHTTHPIIQDAQRPDSPRPPDTNGTTHHTMVRSPRRRATSRQPTTCAQATPRSLVVDLTTPHALHRRPRIQLSENRDRHARQGPEVPPNEVAPPDEDRQAALRQRIETWRSQVVTELPSRLRHPEPIRALVQAVENFHYHFTQDPCNYAYNYDYPDTRRED